MDTTAVPRTVDDVVGRVFDTVVAGGELVAMALGERLGWYDALHDAGASGLSAARLAALTGTDERYAREWLEQQAASGILDVATDPDVFVMADAVGEVMTDRESAAYLAPLVRQMAAATVQLPALLAAYRSGGGVGWAEYGPDMRESQADINRVALRDGVAGWLRLVPGLADRLAAGGRVADIGAGAGWAAVSIARAWPAVTVDTYDVDGPTVEMARGVVAAEGLQGRVVVHHEGVGPGTPDGGYALATAIECIHDMPDPVPVLDAMRRMTAPDGEAVVVDMRVGEERSAPADGVERLMYAFSLLICLPDSMSTPGSVATGTAIRPGTVAAYARQAGWRGVEEVDAGLEVWRMYRLLR